MPAITTNINLNLTSGPGTFSILGTEGRSLSVLLSVKSGGKPFDCTGRVISLWYGPSVEEGHAVVADAVGFGFARFTLAAEDTATRGNLMAQINSTINGISEEWARGWFTLQRDPSAEYDPITWNPTGLTSVATDDTLTGDGTTGSPLSVADAIVNGAAAGATAVQGTPWEDEGYLKAESDTLADVVARNPDANQATITNAASYEARRPPTLRVAGFGTTAANQDYIYDGIQDGKPRYMGSIWNIYWSPAFPGGARWVMERSIAPVQRYTSADDVATPDLATTWVVTFGVSEPIGTVTALPETATITPDGVMDGDEEHVYALRYKTQEFDVGNVSGAVALDARKGTVQTLTVTADITDITINNLAGNVVMLYIDNTADKSILIPSIDLIAGAIPTGPGIFPVFFGTVKGNVLATIGEHFEATGA